MVNHIEPIRIKKKESEQKHIPWDNVDFERLVDGVDLSDVMDFILMTMDGESNHYWSVTDINWHIYYGELDWVIYSYLVDRGLLIVEDKYYSSDMNTGRSKYLDKSGYFNPLEHNLYTPIVDRLSGYYLDKVEENYYMIGKGYLRDKTLCKILQ